MGTEPRIPDYDGKKGKPASLMARGWRLAVAFLRRFSKVQRLFLLLLVVVLVVGPIVVWQIRSVSDIRSRTTNFGLKNIGELATQAGYFTNVQVIKDSRELLGVTLPFTQSKYIYSYDGVIKAGIDFAEIVVEPDEAAHIVRVTLPEVKLLSVEVDQESFQIYDESKSIFTPLELTKINQSFIKLKEKVKNTALANGILENTRANAETLVKGFLASAFDPDIYKVEFR